MKMQCKYMVGQLLLFSLVLISWLPIVDLWYRKMMRILLIFGGLIYNLVNEFLNTRA